MHSRVQFSLNNKENTHEESFNMVSTLDACNTEAGTDTWGFKEHCPN
jgi:hypothetical protein